MRLIDADELRAEWLGAVGEYTAHEILGSIDDMPIIPQEMSVVEFFAEYRRMCEYIGRCATCPIMEIAVVPRMPCRYLAYEYPDKAAAIVEKWAREHPERSDA